MQAKKLINKTSNLLLGLALFIVIGGMNLQAENYDIDEAHSAVKFTTTHLLISEVEGRFTDFDFELNLKDQMIVSLEGEVEVDSVDTDNEDRDGHLRSPDFFDEDEYDDISFKSTSYDKTSDNKGTLKGMLEIKDVKKEVVFSVTISDVVDFKGKKKVGLKLETKINRKDFNVGSSFPSAVVDNEVAITLNLQFDR